MIANGSSGYTMVGCSDVESATNTRIALYGYTYSGYSGNIEYIATSTGSHLFSTGGSGTTYGTERMRITSTGNVGIGTNNPQRPLHVHEFMRIGGSPLSVLDFGNDYTTQIFRTVNDFVLCTSSTGTGQERMRITSTGNVGIGTNNPRYTCHIMTGYDNVAKGLHLDATDFGVDKYTLTIWAYVIGAGQVGWRFRTISDTTGARTAIEINYTGSVYFPNGSSSASDIRIKKDIEDINDESALNKLLLIQPTTYNYIDVERNKGFGKVYGFIAQQIREVIPEAITIIKKQIIPNIYKSCLINNKREVYHIIPLDTPIDTDIKIGGSDYKIKEIYEDYFVIDKDIEDVEVFVFGYSVDDFHSLNKDYIFTLNVCATQELHRRIEAQSVLLKSQEDRIKDLETKVATLMSNM